MFKNEYIFMERSRITISGHGKEYNYHFRTYIFLFPPYMMFCLSLNSNSKFVNCPLVIVLQKVTYNKHILFN